MRYIAAKIAIVLRYFPEPLGLEERSKQEVLLFIAELAKSIVNGGLLAASGQRRNRLQIPCRSRLRRRFWHGPHFAWLGADPCGESADRRRVRVLQSGGEPGAIGVTRAQEETDGV